MKKIDRLIKFEKDEYSIICLVDIDNRPWFAATDVTRTLGYQCLTHPYIAWVDDDDRYSINKTDNIISNISGRDMELIWPNPRDNTKRAFINKSGVKSILERCEMDNVEEIRGWFDDEIFPEFVENGVLKGNVNISDHISVEDIDHELLIDEVTGKLEPYDDIGVTYTEFMEELYKLGDAYGYIIEMDIDNSSVFDKYIDIYVNHPYVDHITIARISVRNSLSYQFKPKYIDMDSEFEKELHKLVILLASTPIEDRGICALHPNIEAETDRDKTIFYSNVVDLDYDDMGKVLKIEYYDEFQDRIITEILDPCYKYKRV